MTFLRRRIDLEFSLGEGNFGETGANTVKCSGLRASVNVMKAGDPSFDTAEIRVWGLPMSVMNTITTLGKPLQYFRDNTVTVYAGDDSSGRALVFTGTIQKAYQDFDGAPDASLNITAFVGLIQANKPASPSSFPGSADVATIMSGLAEQAGLQFENNGVAVQLSNAYFPGTPRQQMQSLARAANVFFTIDGNTVVIWPRDGRRGGDVPLFSPDSGMVGYPRFTDQGIAIRALYRPGVIFGGMVEVKTSIIPACGQWIVNNLRYTLESEAPNGAWFLDLEAYRYENVK